MMRRVAFVVLCVLIILFTHQLCGTAECFDISELHVIDERIIESGEMENFEIINGYFFRDGRLAAYSVEKEKSVYIVPEGTTRLESRIFHKDFLQIIVIPSSCTEINLIPCGEQFLYFDVDPSNPVYASKDGVLYDKDLNTLLMFPPAKTCEVFTVPHTVRKLDFDSFSGNTFVREIILPDGLEAIEGFAFYGMTALEKINIPSSVTYMCFEAFEYCPSLQQIVLEKDSYAENEIGKWAEYIDLRECIVYQTIE